MKNLFVKFTAGTVALSMLSMSVMPGLASAQTVEAETSTATITEEASTSTDAVASVDEPAAVAEETTTQSEGYEVTEVAETNHTLIVTSTEVAETLGSLDGLLEESSAVDATTDVDSAAIVETDAVVVDIPVDPEEPVVFAAEGAPEIEITLPNSEDATNAKTIGEGVVAYTGTGGSANAVQADEDGGVKMLTVIDNASAPTAYAYGVTVPEGGHVELTSDGGAVVLDSANQPIAYVDTPWATDAAGNSVQTWFETDGSTLTQYVIHNVDGVVYPVTADPNFWQTWWQVTKCEGAILLVVVPIYSGISKLKTIGGAYSLAKKIVFRQLTSSQIKSSLINIGLSIFGIDTIINECINGWR